MDLCTITTDQGEGLPSAVVAPQCPYDEPTRRKIGSAAVTSALLGAGIAAAMNPTGAFVAMAGWFAALLSVAASLFPEFFRDVGDCVYLGFETLVRVLHGLVRVLHGLVKVLHGLPSYMKQLKQRLGAGEGFCILHIPHWVQICGRG